MVKFFQRRTESTTSYRYTEFTERNASPPISHLSELKSLIERFGHSLLNVSPRELEKLSIAVQNEDHETYNKLLGRQESNVESNEPQCATNEYSQESFFKNAIETYRTEWVEFYIHMLANKSFDFEEGARIIKDNFKTLWKHYNRLVEEIFESDILGHDICSIDIPIEVFTDESNKGRRFGTGASITKCIQNIQNRTSLSHSSQQNPTGVGLVHEQSKGMVVKTSVRIYCFEDVCKVGLEGILRFLLLNKAPTSLYKTPLVKHIIEFKWDRVWETETKCRLLWFLGLYALIPITLFVLALFFSVFISIGVHNIAFSVIFAMVLFILAGLKALRAWRQCGQYKRDSQEIFSSRSWPGIKHYISSQQNIVDLFLLFTKLFIIAEVFFILLGNTSLRNSLVFSGSLEVFIFVVVAELYYRLQIMKVCGVTAMMIKQIIIKCLPYFCLLLIITAAFGLTMWQTSSRFLHSDKDEKEEKELTRSFENPQKSILTMFYATFGLFDPTEMYHYGTIRWLMLSIFILYMGFQILIILNVVIAAIGDAFDGLRSIEEELFLKARADFIDRSEASLSKKNIKPIKESIGKYLYVLVPEEKHLKKDETSWNGRMIAIKEDVKKIVLDSQEEMTKKIDKFKEEMNQQTNIMYSLTQKMDFQTQDMNEMFEIIRDNIRSMDKRIKTLEENLIDEDADRWEY